MEGQANRRWPWFRKPFGVLGLVRVRFPLLPYPPTNYVGGKRGKQSHYFLFDAS